MNNKWKHRESNKIKEAGITKYHSKTIVINPSKGDIISTILHERVHKEFPEFSEVLVLKLEAYILRNLNMRQQKKILDKFIKALPKKP